MTATEEEARPPDSEPEEPVVDLEEPGPDVDPEEDDEEPDGAPLGQIVVGAGLVVVLLVFALGQTVGLWPLLIVLAVVAVAVAAAWWWWRHKRGRSYGRTAWRSPLTGRPPRSSSSSAFRMPGLGRGGRSATARPGRSGGVLSSLLSGGRRASGRTSSTGSPRGGSTRGTPGRETHTSRPGATSRTSRARRRAVGWFGKTLARILRNTASIWAAFSIWSGVKTWRVTRWLWAKTRRRTPDEPAEETPPGPGEQQASDETEPAAETAADESQPGPEPHSGPNEEPHRERGERGTMFPLAEAAIDLTNAAAHYESDDMMQVHADLQRLHELPLQAANAIRVLADTLDSQYPIDPAVTERLRALFEGFSALIPVAEEVPSVFQQVHEDDIARRTQPRVGEEKWNA